MLSGKVAIVTGAGRGIGRAISLAFAKKGTDLILVSRTLQEVLNTATQVENLGRRAIAIKADISNKNDVIHVIDRSLKEFGKVDILVNNAGILGPVGLMIDNDPDEWVKTINVNLLGTFFCCKAVLPHMIKRQKGKIINISGGGAAYPRPRFSAYATSKTAIVRLTETLAEEVKEFNIDINVIAPGAVNTKMWKAILEAGDKAGEKALNDARELEKTGGVSDETPASLAVFLASDHSNGLTGRLISAVWDDWQNMRNQINSIMSTDMYTLRRMIPQKK